MNFEMDIFITTVNGKLIEKEAFKPLVNKSYDYTINYMKTIYEVLNGLGYELTLGEIDMITFKKDNKTIELYVSESRAA